MGQQEVRLRIFEKIRKELEKMERSQVLPEEEP